MENPEVEKLLEEIGGTIGRQLPEGWGFNLLLFTFEPGSTFYISNANREDMIRELEDFLAKEKRGDL